MLLTERLLSTWLVHIYYQEKQARVKHVSAGNVKGAHVSAGDVKGAHWTWGPSTYPERHGVAWSCTRRFRGITNDLAYVCV